MEQSVFVAVLLLFTSSTTEVAAIDLNHRQLLSSMSMTPVPPDSIAPIEPEVRWGTNGTHIEIQLAYPTLGWLALGMSPNGGMDQSDVLFGYVVDTTGEVVVQDRYIVAPDISKGVNLTLDSQQDWIKVSGSQNGSHTTIRAVRKLRTCDPFDRPFTAGTLKMIFSYNPRDPASPDARPQKHTQRGSAAINFLQPVSRPDDPTAEPIVQWLNVTIDNFPVNGTEVTEYICRLVKLPTFTNKLHAISNYPVIDPRTADLIHHIVLFTCTNPLPVTADTSGRAFDCGANSNNRAMNMCGTMIGLWAVGGQPSHYPPEAGLPFTSDMSGTYFLLQVHYNNPMLKKGLLDNSGMAYSLTNKLRQHDVGTLATGILNVDPIFAIPPGLDEFRMTAQCPDKCTSKLPPAGINIFEVNIHMHTRGRVGVGRHFRGNTELEPFVNNQNYDFNYQTSADLTPKRTFLPGDRIVTECTFTTKTDDKVIFGGENTDNEMCLLFFAYYPRSSVQYCAVDYTVSGYMQAVGFPYSQLMAMNVTKKPDETVFEALDTLYNKRHFDASCKRYLEQVVYPQLVDYTNGKQWTVNAIRKMEDFYRSKHYTTGSCGVSGDLPPFIEPLVDWSDYQCSEMEVPEDGFPDQPSSL